MTVDGYTSGSCPTQPAQLANECHSTTHKPEVYNTVGDVGGWEAGSAVYWADYLSGTNDQQTAATPGTEYTFSSEGEVICSAVGGIYGSSGTVYLKIVFDTVITSSFQGTDTCIVEQDCYEGKAATCPTSRVEDTQGCAVGYICADIAYRFSQSDPFSCLGLELCRPAQNLPGLCN